MIITTTNELPDRKILRTLGLVRGTSVRGRHIGVDLIAHLRNAVGGEIHEYTKMLSEAREQALDRMTEEARELGANAVVGMRFTTSSPTPGSSEVLVYGTAVVVEDPLAQEPGSG
ncbi:MAG: YbjQ family protein [Holophagales bacterium]|nr:YbjQ family protein [Holophagales bacterium]